MKQKQLLDIKRISAADFYQYRLLGGIRMATGTVTPRAGYFGKVTVLSTESPC